MRHTCGNVDLNLEIFTLQGCVIEITNVHSCQDYIVHYGVLREGNVSERDKVDVTVNRACRENCTRNHTATHIINYALEKCLGGVQQCGSIVKPDKLQFDFTCAKVSIYTSACQ